MVRQCEQFEANMQNMKQHWKTVLLNINCNVITHTNEYSKKSDHIFTATFIADGRFSMKEIEG